MCSKASSSRNSDAICNLFFLLDTSRSVGVQAEWSSLDRSNTCSDYVSIRLACFSIRPGHSSHAIETFQWQARRTRCPKSLIFAHLFLAVSVVVRRRRCMDKQKTREKREGLPPSGWPGLLLWHPRGQRLPPYRYAPI